MLFLGPQNIRPLHFFLGKQPKLESGSKTTPKTETLGEEQPLKYGVFWIM